MTKGELLKQELKKKRGLSFRFVAEKTDIPYETFKQYINDYREIPDTKLRCVCLTFGLDLKIFGLDDTYKFQDDQQNNERKAV